MTGPVAVPVSPERKEITHRVKMEKIQNPRNLKDAATFQRKNRSI
jgi:hypothetical protein